MLAEDKRSIHIVVASNNHFAVMLAALLKSIESNINDNWSYTIYIINDNISRSNKDKISSSVSSSYLSLKWIDKTTVLPLKLQYPTDRSGLPLTTYLRLLAPYIVPEETDRVLYLDVDMLVLGDLSDLWEVDLQDYPIAAVTDRAKVVSSEWAGIPNYRELGLKPDDKYFNAGLLLIDVKKWIAGNYSSLIIENMKRYKEHVVFADQYGLNVTFANNWLELSAQWNWYSNEYIANANIVHFVGVKPIYTSYDFAEEFRALFYHYVEKTGFEGYKPRSKWVRTGMKVKNLLDKYLYKIKGM